MMKVDLTRKEYRDLIDMLYIAEWVLNAHRMADDPRTRRYKTIEQKFLALAKQMKYENLIEYYPDDKKWYPTKEFEETSMVHPFIEEFEDDTFWNELAVRLSARDLIRQMGGVEKANALSFEERITRLFDTEAAYNDEFERNGLNNFELRKKRPPRQPRKGVH